MSALSACVSGDSYRTLLGNEYSERTIYHSFIYFCYNNPNITFTDDLITLCGEMGSTIKSDAFGFKTLYNEVQEYFENMKGAHPLDSRVDLLKRDGFNFTNEAMVNLVNAINKQRIVKIAKAVEPSGEPAPVQPVNITTKQH